MPFNQNHSYGKMIANSLAARFPAIGNVFFVSGSSLQNWERLTEMFPVGPEGKTRVFTTLASAAAQLTSGKNDLIFVADNHTETISAAAGISIAGNGATIIGLGEADERPLISFDTLTTADFDITGNGVTIENMRFDLTGVDALAGPIDVNASGVTFRKCEFITADSGGQATVGIVTDATCDYFKLESCVFTGSTDAGTKSAVRIVGGSYAQIRDCFFEGNYKITAGAIEVTTTAAGFLLLEKNTILNKTASAVSAVNLLGGTGTTIRNNIFHVQTGSTPVTLNEGANSNGGGPGGRTVVGANYYRAATTISAGTLL